MKIKAIIFLMGVAVGIVNTAWADNNGTTHTVQINIPNVALLDLESSGLKDFTISFNSPTEAGLGLTVPTTSSTIYLNYSSIVASSGSTSRTVKAQITNGTVPAGTQLTVSVSTDNQEGSAGTLGTKVAGQIPITASATNIINNIGSCYTGTTDISGHALTFSLRLVAGEYSLLRHGNSPVTVTYTLMDN